MPARQIKSLPTPGQGYKHREHRSRKSLKGLNTKIKRERRLMRLGKEKKKHVRLTKKIKSLIERI